MNVFEVFYLSDWYLFVSLGIKFCIGVLIWYDFIVFFCKECMIMNII